MSYLNGLWDGWQVAEQLQFFRVQHPGFVQNNARHPWATPMKLFLSAFSVRTSGAAIQQYWHSYSFEDVLFHFISGINFNMVVNLSITVHNLSMCMLISLLVDEILLPRYINRSTNFSGLSFNEMTPCWLKYILYIIKLFVIHLYKTSFKIYL